VAQVESKISRKAERFIFSKLFGISAFKGSKRNKLNNPTLNRAYSEDFQFLYRVVFMYDCQRR
jgi:hypothetical protein